MKRKTRFAIAMSITVIGLIVVFGGSLSFHFVKKAMIAQALAAYRPPPATISAATSKTVHWRPFLQAIGTLSAINGVEISNEVAGKVRKIAFHSGDTVKEGKLLVRLDISQEKAQLAQFKAQLQLAKRKYERQVTLSKKGLNSQQDLDTARAAYKKTQAQVKGEQALINKMTIESPFAGRLGIRQINLGQFLSPGTTIVQLTQIKPLHVTFTLPQADLSRVHTSQAVAVNVGAYSGQDFSGKITAISPVVSNQSRTLQVQATIPNNEALLRPGMFANIKIYADKTEKKVVIPQTAITYSLYGDTVYVLKPLKQTSGKNKKSSGKAPETTEGKKQAKRQGQTVYSVKQVIVQPGIQRGKLIAVTGLKPGVKVVTAGQLKLHTGSRAMINNDVSLGKNRNLSP